MASQKVLVAFSCVFIGTFAASWGPIPWVVTRNFLMGFITPYLVDEGVGKAGLGVKVFWLWAAFCFSCIIFCFFLIPETKGLSLEQVELLYVNSTILKSNSYRREMIANNMHEGMTPAEKAVQEKLEMI